MIGIVKKVWYLLEKRDRIKLFFIMAILIGGSVAELLGVAILLPIVNLAIDDNYAENIWCKMVINLTGRTEREDILLILIGTTIAIYIFKSLYLIWMYNESYKFSARIKSEMAEKMMIAYLKQPYKFFLNKNSSEIIRAVNQDSGHIYEIIVNIIMIFSSGLTTIALITTLLLTNVMMTFVVSIFLAISGLIIVFVVQKKIRYYGGRNQVLSGFLIKYLQQNLEGIKEIKILGNEDYFVKRYISTYKEMADVGRKNSLVNMIPKYFVEAVVISAIMLYFGINVKFNPNYMEIIPQLTVFVAAAVKLMPSVNSIFSYFNTLMYHKAPLDLVYKDIKEADKLDNGELLLGKKHEKLKFVENASLKDVTFRYDNTTKTILENINLSIEKGKSIALIGPSGGGKTTTADIILGLLEPTEGKVLVDGVDIRTNLQGWRRQFGYIPQTIYLTDDTIKNNIALGVAEEDIDEEKVWNAIKKAQLFDFVQELDKGLDTMIGERGARISGGQRQRIGIARALYHDPEILVFDEATSALDNNTEKEVMNAIESLQGTKTMIIIAHRLSTIEKCDEVYRIEKGQVVKER